MFYFVRRKERQVQLKSATADRQDNRSDKEHGCAAASVDIDFLLFADLDSEDESGEVVETVC